MVLFKSLVNGKVANGGRENDRGNLGCSAVAYTAKKPCPPLDVPTCRCATRHAPRASDAVVKLPRYVTDKLLFSKKELC